MNSTIRSTCLIAALIALVALIPTTARSEKTPDNEAVVKTSEMMQVDLDGDGIRELFRVEENDLYVFLWEKGGWVRGAKVLTDVKRLFGNTPITAIVGTTPPGETTPYEMLVIPKNMSGKFPIVRFHNPYYKRLVPAETIPPLELRKPPIMIST